MKILAIRGENIASLSQPFAVEFAQSPLARHGLIAITGKTGAGKSSLLDAMCLTLYEQVPRFSGKERSVEVGNEQEAQKLKANDVRHLVSRGKAEGYCEVDFIAADGKSYRAKWQARRARNQLNGKWQKSTRELVCLADNSVSSANKREFQQQLDELIGLDYEQFRRAVVLPQGDFAAFLKAPEEQRSALLERMTGTELYSRISQQVYENAKQEQQALARLQEQLSAVDLLDDEQRAALLQQQQVQQQQIQQTEQAINLQHRFAQQQQQLQQSEQGLLRQQQQLAQHLSQAQAQQELQQQVTQLDALEPLRADWLSLQQAQQEQQRLQQLAQQYAENITSLSQQELSLRQQLQQAETSLEQFKTEQVGQAEEAAQAQRLDGQLSQLGAQLEALEPEHRAKQAELLKLRSKLQALATQQQYFKSELAQLESWLDQHQALQALPQQAELLQNHLAQLDELNLSQQQQRQVELGLQQQQQGLAQAEQELTAQLTELTAKISSLSDAEELPSEASLSKQQQSILEQREQLKSLQAQLQALGPLTQYLQQQQLNQQELAELKQALASRAQAKTQLEQTQLALQAKQQEAEQAWHNARAVLGLDELRQQLRDDEACPLCGSLEHPYAKQLPQVASLLSDLEQRYRQLQAEYGQNAQYLHQAQAEQAALQQRVQQLESQQPELEQFIEQAQLVLQAVSATAPSDVLEAERQLAELQAQWQRLEKRLEQAEQQQWQAQQALQHFQQLSHQQAQLQQGLHSLTEQSAQLNQRDAELQQQAESLQLREQKLLEQVAELLPGVAWRQWYQQGGAALCWQHLQELIAGIAEAQQGQQGFSEQLSNLAQESANLAQLAQATEQQEKQLAEQGAELESQFKAYVTQRRALLGGMQIAQWQAQQQQREQQLFGAVQQVANSLQQLQQQLAAFNAQQKQASEDGVRIQEQVEGLQQTLQAGFASHGLSQQQGQALLSQDPQQVQRWREQLANYRELQAQLEAAIKQAEQHIEAVQQALAQQQSELESALITLELEDATMLEACKQALQEQLFALRSRLEQDQAAQLHSKELASQLKQQSQQSELWDKMNELIGSASGAKFRIFAQQLTLENLLTEANRQLQEIAPRYRLQRVPSAALALQVIDRDMGDEVRSIASLSGGETFLVSLALALALSGVASSKLKIQSLFIDEGFGSLDPESLDIALSCLDSLQASGRQVTVISHVQALVERIAAKITLRPLGAGRSEVLVSDV